MKISTLILGLLGIGLAGAVAINSAEKKGETLFTSEGVEIVVLEAESRGGTTRIVEPNGEVSIFSDRMKKQELTRIAEKQREPWVQLNYSFHRIARFLKRKFSH